MTIQEATASAAHKRNAIRAARFEDLLWLREQGVGPSEAITQVGWTPGAAEVAARRYAQDELHKWLLPLVSEKRKRKS